MPAMKRAWSVLVLALTAVAVPADGRERVVRLKVGPFRIEAHRDREVCQAVRIHPPAAPTWLATRRARGPPGRGGRPPSSPSGIQAAAAGDSRARRGAVRAA